MTTRGRQDDEGLQSPQVALQQGSLSSRDLYGASAFCFLSVSRSYCLVDAAVVWFLPLSRKTRELSIFYLIFISYHHLQMPSFFRSSHLAVAIASILPALSAALPQQIIGSTSNPESLCGNNNGDVLLNTPWIVDNLVYNADQMVGTQCTYYDRVETPAGQDEQIVWSSVANIEYVQSTYASVLAPKVRGAYCAKTWTRNNVPKGYSFVGLTKNLENALSDISSIPSTYSWTRTNSTAFKGRVGSLHIRHKSCSL